MGTADTLTPMMRQYRRIKAELPEGVILMFRLGDFYEMFFDDAKEVAGILDIALTKRNGVPMCGVPHHSVDAYMAKLIRASKKVAVCDQVEDPGVAKGIVKREVTRVVTPGTATEERVLDSGNHHFLAGVFRDPGGFGVALLDLSTGLFFGETMATPEAVNDALKRHGVVECVLPQGIMQDAAMMKALRDGLGIPWTPQDEWVFDAATAADYLQRHFGVKSLDGLGCADSPAFVGAAGAILHYVREDLKREARHVRTLRLNRAGDGMVLDESTCANLDLAPMRGRAAQTTLLGVLNVTRTAMGSRLMRDWILRPLTDLAAIVARHDAVDSLRGDRQRLSGLRDALAPVRDMERIIGRINAGTGNARDLAALGQSLASVPSLRDVTGSCGTRLLKSLAGSMNSLPSLVELVAKSIVDEPPVTVKEGGMIRDGYDAGLDELRKLAKDARSWLAEYQAKEQERTGIKTLKVRHNNVFGYFIEISRAQSDKAPAEYIRKQTVVNAERFITPELKEYETKITGAQEKATALEYEIFSKVRDAAVAETARIQATASAIGQVDVLAALADRSLAFRYVRPKMTDGDVLRIREGRHAVVEQMPDAERFVPNDSIMNGSDHQVIVITGPNMAGKSTYIRQVGLIVIMAQMGSFVPASEAEIGVVDRVFTRVGASDDLARGRSTFLVEMQETAAILNSATARSLIILDEIGRGTSTFDGISIAWAVAEFLHNTPQVKAKTLFATHYHELTDLALTMPGVKNFNVLVKESGDGIVFLRKIVPGGSDKSYGIHVAGLAGMPPEVIDRAREIMSNLEEGEFAETGQPKIARQRRKLAVDGRQLTLFG